MENQKYIIYVIKNLINNKNYVGKTRKTLKKMWSVHVSHALYDYDYKKKKSKSYIQNSIKKYGVENFEIKQIDEAFGSNHSIFLENFYIKYYNALDPKYGYNLVLSEGDRLVLRKETLEKMRKFTHDKGKKYIIYDKRRDKWQFRICMGGKAYTGRTKTEEEAKVNIDLLNIFLYNDYTKLFFSDKLEYYSTINKDDFIKSFDKEIIKKYTGVSFQDDKYSARICEKKSTVNYKDKRLYLGIFNTEEEAAIAVDKANFYLKGHLYNNYNFPELIDENQYIKDGKILYENSKQSHKRAIGKIYSSKYIGVTRDKQKKNSWCYEFRKGGKRFRGSAKSELEAAQLRDKLAIENGETKRLNSLLIY